MTSILAIGAGGTADGSLARIASEQGWSIKYAEGLGDAVPLVEANDYDLIFIHQTCLSQSLITRLRSADPVVGIVVTSSSHLEPRGSQAALRCGADWYMVEPFRDAAVILLIARMNERRRFHDENDRLRGELGRIHAARLDPVKSTTNGLLRPWEDQACRAAKTDLPILIVGESGVGKTRLARLVHQLSNRGDGPLIEVTFIPGAVEGQTRELFGAERVETGKKGGPLGALELAANGTLLLEEISDICPPTQAQLLESLQTRSVHGAGARRPRSIDVRVVATTSKSPEALASAGFRRDLYDTVGAFVVRIPPLADRAHEIHELVQQLLRDLSSRRPNLPTLSVAADAVEALTSYRWPGNVRELRNAVEHAVVMAQSGIVRSSSLPDSVRPQGVGHVARIASSQWDERGGFSFKDRMMDLERAMVVEALHREKGVQARAARLLEVTERSMWHLVKKHGINVRKLP